MKLLLFFGAILILLSAIHAQFPPQQEKEAILRLSMAELQTLYGIVDESATAGSIRKPLLLKIENAYKAAFATTQSKDTSKPKRN